MIQFSLPLFAATPVCVIPLCAIRRGSPRAVRTCLRPSRMPCSSSPFANSYARHRLTLPCEACSFRFPIELMRPRGAICLSPSVSAHSDWNCCSFSPAPGLISFVLLLVC
ncbi:hypothetical protein BDA96_03G338300 [Sorghum bicolor]|uniref:Uncharacterized protein n=2 Tax=Sorghum bicolor TaxID=4558 RepID=A0A921UPQ5_SORBI|nr:hypothetical protein BDA96_03G338300 [Sorghum bicolor]KXG33490.1 hypothetical protein SORBI_3003G313600 [Sorghum bicolor]